jgi:hypothetical protein
LSANFQRGHAAVRKALNLSVAALVALTACADPPQTRRYGAPDSAPTRSAAPRQGDYSDPPDVLSSAVYDPVSFAVGQTIHEVVNRQKDIVSWYFHPNGYAYVTSNMKMSALYKYTIYNDGTICLSYTNECLMIKRITRPRSGLVVPQDVVYHSGGTAYVILKRENGDPNGIVPWVVDLMEQRQRQQDVETLAMLAVLGAGVVVALAATSGSLPELGGGGETTAGSPAPPSRTCPDGSLPANGSCRAAEESRPASPSPSAPAIDPFFDTSPGVGAGGASIPSL